jgi:hypothetical protein
MGQFRTLARKIDHQKLSQLIVQGKFVKGRNGLLHRYEKPKPKTLTRRV